MKSRRHMSAKPATCAPGMFFRRPRIQDSPAYTYITIVATSVAHESRFIKKAISSLSQSRDHINHRSRSSEKGVLHSACRDNQRIRREVLRRCAHNSKIRRQRQPRRVKMCENVQGCRIWSICDPCRAQFPQQTVIRPFQHECSVLAASGRR